MGTTGCRSPSTLAIRMCETFSFSSSPIKGGYTKRLVSTSAILAGRAPTYDEIERVAYNQRFLGPYLLRKENLLARDCALVPFGDKTQVLGSQKSTREDNRIEFQKHFHCMR